MNINLETIGFFLYMEEQERKEARSKSEEQETDEIEEQD